jgi:hypothetical protein
MEKLFFLNPKWRLVSRWRFCHFIITLFSKNLQKSATTNTKTKTLMDLQRIDDHKKKSLQAKKFNMAPKIKMAANLDFFLKFYCHSMVYA